MSENVLSVVRQDIMRVIERNYPQLSQETRDSYVEKVLVAIDWNNPALAHKGVASFAKLYLERNLVLV